ncbi:MAG TPA: hypothetical protein VIK93_12365 [Limnochordales bacterium]
MLRFEEGRIAPPAPYIVSADAQLFTGIVRMNETLILALDLHRLLSAAERRETEQVALYGLLAPNIFRFLGPGCKDHRQVMEK